MAAQAVAFDFTAGYINVVNFGFAAFVGLGGYTSGLLAVDLGIPPVIGMVVGGFVSGLVGMVTGALTLRLRGIYAAVMAWFVGLALMGTVRNLPELTRGSLGLAVPALLDSPQNLPYYYVILAMLVVTFGVLAWVIRSRFGLAFRAIGQNLAAARASGINPTRYLVINFVLSCAFAGSLGGFYAHYYGILTPDVMLTSHTVEILAIAYIGGRGSLWGAAVVAFPLSIGVEFVKVQFYDPAGCSPHPLRAAAHPRDDLPPGRCRRGNSEPGRLAHSPTRADRGRGPAPGLTAVRLGLPVVRNSGTGPARARPALGRPALRRRSAAG